MRHRLPAMDGHTYLTLGYYCSKCRYVCTAARSGQDSNPLVDVSARGRCLESHALPSPLLNSGARIEHTSPLVSRPLLCLSLSMHALCGTLFFHCHAQPRALKLHEKAASQLSPHRMRKGQTG